MALNSNTPVEHYPELGLYVKREDLSCSLPGPPFSKTRGVWSHVRKASEHGIKHIGVLDTYHSQAGWAVSEACAHFKLDCINFYPEYKKEPGHRRPQDMSKANGASLVGLPAGRSAVLYQTARKYMSNYGDRGYMMPNALKLPETVTETALEVGHAFSVPGYREFIGKLPWVISASSGTIAAGVIRGLMDYLPTSDPIDVIIHQGYDRSQVAIDRYIREKSGLSAGWASQIRLHYINEGYGYKDQSRVIHDLPFPANPYYDMKAVHWWLTEGRPHYGQAFLWLIG